MRPATAKDVDAAMAALIAMKAKNPDGWMKYTDEDSARCGLYEHMQYGKAVMVDGYFVMFDIGRPWHSKDQILFEELIIRVEPTSSPVAVAIAALDELKVKHNCKIIVASDTQIGYMVPHYQAAGFKTIGTQLMKE